MINTIHVDAKDPSVARLLPGHKGREAKIIPDLEEGKSFSFQGNYWSGGSKNDYVVKDLLTGKEKSIPTNQDFPRFREQTAVIPRGCVVIEYSIFCGKKMPPRIHAHKMDIAPLLPKPQEITEHLARCLIATAALKNTYGGETGIRQKRSGLTLEEWNVAKETCISNGWMRKNGAITREGRNAIEGHPLRFQIH